MKVSWTGFKKFWKNLFKSIGDVKGLREIRAALGVFLMGVLIALMNPLTSELLRADMRIEWITFWIAVYYLFVGTVATKLVIWLFKTKPEDLPVVPTIGSRTETEIPVNIKNMFTTLLLSSFEELNGKREMLKEAEAAAEVAVEKTMAEFDKIQDEVAQKTEEALEALKEATIPEGDIDHEKSQADEPETDHNP